MTANAQILVSRERASISSASLPAQPLRDPVDLPAHLDQLGGVHLHEHLELALAILEPGELAAQGREPLPGRSTSSRSGEVPGSPGVERMLSLYYVKTKEIEVNAGRIVGRLMKLREEADYYPESTFGLNESTDALKMANEFVEHIQKVIKFDT